MLQKGKLLLDQQYFNKFAEIYNRENPNHTYTQTEVNEFACNVVKFLRLTYKPIPKDKLDLFNSLK